MRAVLVGLMSGGPARDAFLQAVLAEDIAVLQSRLGKRPVAPPS